MNFFDLHCDTAWTCYKNHYDFKSEKLAVNPKKGEGFEKWYQTFAVWVKDEQSDAFELYCNILSNFKNILADKPDNLYPVFAVEGGAVIEGKPERVEILKKDGIRFISLTWNGENALAGGVNTEKGLSETGKEVLKEMNRLKIACDLSHLNEKSFFDAVEISDFPIATHSNCYDICSHPRNLKPDQIKLIAEKCGIIGINFYPPFLGDNIFEAIYQNLFYLADKGYENNIAIGSDFDGGEMDEKLDGTNKIHHLYNYLLNRNLEKELLNKIFYKNAKNYLAKL